MKPVDWAERVTLHRRLPSHHSGGYESVPVATGDLYEMINQVFLMSRSERATIWIDGPSIGRVGIFEVIALSMRPDFPRGL